MAVRSRDVASLAADVTDDYGKTFARLTRMFRARGLTPDDASDLAQEAITLTLTHVRRHGRRSRDLDPLINTIARNLLIERFRTGGRELATDITEQHLPHSDDIAGDVTRREGARIVRAAVDELPPRQRDAVLMWMDGAGPGEIAREFDLKRNAADALLHRAKKRLATALSVHRDSLLGAPAFVWLRTRTRRLTWFLGGAEGSSAGPSVATGVVALGAALVIALASSPEPTTAPEQTAGAPTVTLTLGEAPSLGVVPPSMMTGGSPSDAALTPRNEVAEPKPGVSVDVRDHHVAVLGPTIQNPLTEKEDPPLFEIESWHEREEGQRGFIGPKLDEGTTLVCDNAPAACHEVEP
jgi:RNA polymerase sigma factor (sigma-70 family)